MNLLVDDNNRIGLPQEEVSSNYVRDLFTENYEHGAPLVPGVKECLICRKDTEENVALIFEH